MALIPQFPGGLTKCLTLSYDDSVIANRRLVDIFNKNGLKATFHINSGRLDQTDHLTSKDITETLAGHEISCHSFTHPFLDRIPPMDAMREVWDDRAKLEALTGTPVIGMSYPYGTYNQTVLDILKSAGIVYSRTTAATGRFILPGDYLTWHPTCHHRDMLELLPAFLTSRYPCSCFYVWGHAYEFDRNNNWEDMEKFAAEVSHREDVWYATNIEIYRYDMAAKSLVVSTSGKSIYNPSALTVWFGLNGENYSIKPGETLSI